MNSLRKIGIKGILIFLNILYIHPNIFGQDLTTYFEKSQYKRTPRYDSTVMYCHTLEKAVPFIKVTSIGKSHEGREIVMLIAASNQEFTPEKAKLSGKNIVLIQACIHAGEPDGKDAGFLLFKDFVQNESIRKLLNDNIVLFIPILNVDGHERFGPYNRINQDGPIEMGWRCNAQNLNLNRDYLKAQSAEIKAWLNTFYTWSPDFFIDCHVTDGADYHYPITYALEIYGSMSDSITNWQKEKLIPSLEQRMQKEGFPIFRYVSFRNWFDFESGLSAWVTPPSLSQGLTALVDCPGLLIESHMLKNYKTRVLGTYHMIKNVLQLISEQNTELKKYRANSNKLISIPKQLPVSFKALADSQIIAFKGVEYTVEKSDLSGGKWFKYNTQKPKTYQLPLFDHFVPAKTVDIPNFYIVPSGWADKIIPYLDIHRISYKITEKDSTIDCSFYKFSNVKLASGSYEGCQRVNSYDISTVIRKEYFRKGSLIISTKQPHYKILIHLLEPDAPASLLTFGFFNAIFEQKEYGETYVLESLAREMLKNNEIKTKFESFKANNPKAESYEILNWFYLNSNYSDPYLNLYPIGKSY
ncbi:MAG TPA: M14 family zinc carboxypeptidase [Bacteroidales bacterium]|nr:M14 family zinc carboxypeptidase [Bacteroidales bacterium]